MAGKEGSPPAGNQLHKGSQLHQGAAGYAQTRVLLRHAAVVQQLEVVGASWLELVVGIGLAVDALQLQGLLDGLPQGVAVLPCQLVQGLQCLPPDATAGGVQDTQQVDVVVVVGADPQVADDILYLLALEKAGAAADGVGDVGRKEGLLDGATLGVGPHQHPEVVVASFL